MPTKTKRIRVTKAAAEGVESLIAAEPAKVHELTSITVEEVSLVDRPANERTFLLRKKAEEEAAAAAAALQPVAESVETLDLVAAAKAAEDLKVKDAADKAASAKASAAPAQTAEDLVAAAKAEITVETIDGAITVSVEDAPAPTPIAPTELIDKVKAATLAGIDSIAARVAKFRSDVETGTTSPYSSNGTSDALWGHIYYIKGMLDALYDIGGPSWEIEAATEKSVEKAGHKSITASRVAKMSAIHKGLTYCMKDYAGLMKELTQEAVDSGELETDLPAGKTDKAAPAIVVVPVAATPATVVAPAPTIVVQDPAIGELRSLVDTLKSTVAQQAADIAKARNVIGSSNSLQADHENVANDVPNRATVVWPADMAAAPQRSRF